MIAATPASPKSAPVILRGVSGSSASSSPATTAPNTAVVPLRIEARPLSMRVWPQKISEKGMALMSAPMTRSAAQIRGLRGRAMPRRRMTRNSTGSAQTTRCSVTVSGGTAWRAISAKKNEPPQTVASPAIIRPAAGGMLGAGAMRRAWHGRAGQATRILR